MSSILKKKAADLAKELRMEIKNLEAEVAQKKSLLGTLNDMKRPFGGARKIGRSAPTYGKASAGMTVDRRTRRRKPIRRKSKNREIIIDAASKLKGRFTLAQLIEKIHQKNPKFGGKYPSGIVLAVFKTTPEIKKVKRGLYSLKG